MIAKAGQRGLWITTFPTGTRFYPQTPRPEDVHIEDIAHSLPMQARFLGHTARHYSVGEHSCHVADWIWRVTGDRGAAACGLLHDAEEAYLGDMPRPVKHYGPLRAYRSLGGRVSAAIFARFGIAETYEKYEALVKMTDDQMLHTESRRLNHKAEWEDDDKILSKEDVVIDRYSEQEVIDVLSEAIQKHETVTSEGADVDALELLEAARLAREKLMHGGAHARWWGEFMDRYERWVR